MTTRGDAPVRTCHVFRAMPPWSWPWLVGLVVYATVTGWWIDWRRAR